MGNICNKLVELFTDTPKTGLKLNTTIIEGDNQNDIDSTFPVSLRPNTPSLEFGNETLPVFKIDVTNTKLYQRRLKRKNDQNKNKIKIK